MSMIPSEFVREPAKYVFKVRDYPIGQLTTVQKMAVRPDSELSQRIGNIVADAMKENAGDRLVVVEMTIAIQCDAVLVPPVNE